MADNRQMFSVAIMTGKAIKERNCHFSSDHDDLDPYPRPGPGENFCNISHLRL